MAESESITPYLEKNGPTPRPELPVRPDLYHREQGVRFFHLSAGIGDTRAAGGTSVKIAYLQEPPRESPSEGRVDESLTCDGSSSRSTTVPKWRLLEFPVVGSNRRFHRNCLVNWSVDKDNFESARPVSAGTTSPE